MYKLSEQEEEILESLWIEIKEKKTKPNLHILRDETAFKDLVEKKLVDLDSEAILTKDGLKEAKNCVRRHRLAERLMSDILNVKDPVLHEVSCKFEHGLHYGLEDNICTLLGHPQRCPHGKPIPRGDCCSSSQKTAKRLVAPLKDLKPGDSGKISYINTHDSEILKKLISMGVLPGNTIKLLHRFPSFVFEMSGSSFAVDNDLAENIHVLLLNS